MESMLIIPCGPRSVNVCISLVARREARKAHRDMLLFGTGVVWCPNDGGDPKHIPIEEFQWPVGVSRGD